MDIIRVGLIGAGFIGQMRARAIAQLSSELELVAVADTREELVRKLAGDSTRVYRDGEALIADQAVEAVILSTPPISHETLGMACLNAGKHLLCEKPLAMSVDACERLVAAGERNRVCLATGFTLRQTPPAKLAKRLLAQGAIGELDHIRAFHGHRGGSDFGPDWITDQSMTGGGSLMDNGIHMIDLARWFLGDVAQSTGYASNHTWRKPGCEDNGIVVMRSAEGKLAYVQGSWTEWRGYGWWLEIYGTRGSIRLSFPPMWLVHTHGAPGEKMTRRRHVFPVYQVLERIRGWQWSLVETLVDDLRDWASAIRNGSSAPASGRDGLEAVRIAKSVEFEETR